MLGTRPVFGAKYPRGTASVLHIGPSCTKGAGRERDRERERAQDTQVTFHCMCVRLHFPFLRKNLVSKLPEYKFVNTPS